MASASAPSATATDRRLLDLMAQGDDRALSALYDRYAPPLYAVAFRIAGERADAEEILLDAFAQAWREAARFRAERGSVIAWLTMICRSRALDLVRGRARRARLATAARSAEPGASPAMGSGTEAEPPDVEAGERREVVLAALQELPAPQRLAVELAYYQGLSHSEIAERLGEPLGTIKTRVRLAMQRLRESLRPYHHEPSA